MEQKKVGFAGTMQISSFYLDALLNDSRFSVDFVITKPDTSKERNDLSDYLSTKNQEVKVYTPKSISEMDQQLFNNLDAFIVVAYGEKIPDHLLGLTKWINVHASILPALRGASPIQYAIYLGLKKTGITLISMSNKIDAGPVIAKKEVEIEETDTFGSLSTRIGQETASWFVDILHIFLNGNIATTSQEDKNSTKAPLIKKTFRSLDWNEPAELLERKVRALYPSPYALASVKGVNFKVLESEIINDDSDMQPGKLLSNKNLIVKTSTNCLRMRKIIPEGKKSMTDEEFLRGFKIKD